MNINKKYWRVYTKGEVPPLQQQRKPGNAKGLFYKDGNIKIKSTGVGSYQILPYIFLPNRNNRHTSKSGPFYCFKRMAGKCFGLDYFGDVFVEVAEFEKFYSDVEELDETLVYHTKGTNSVEFNINESKSDNSIESETIKDFIYKVDDSSNILKIQSNYDSIDAFFNDTSDKSYIDHECIAILTVDTKIPIIKLEKTNIKDKKVYRFIVDITNEDGDNFVIKSIIDSKDKFNQLLQSTIDSLKNYPQFSKYADDL